MLIYRELTALLGPGRWCRHTLHRLPVCPVCRHAVRWWTASPASTQICRQQQQALQTHRLMQPMLLSTNRLPSPAAASMTAKTTAAPATAASAAVSTATARALPASRATALMTMTMAMWTPCGGGWQPTAAASSRPSTMSLSQCDTASTAQEPCTATSAWCVLHAGHTV